VYSKSAKRISTVLVIQKQTPEKITGANVNALF
jgi:hypothetical protein